MLCSICLDDFDESKKLTCDHEFCYVCIDAWLEKHNTCPLCRTPQISDLGKMLNQVGNFLKQVGEFLIYLSETQSITELDHRLRN